LSNEELQKKIGERSNMQRIIDNAFEKALQINKISGGKHFGVRLSNIGMDNLLRFSFHNQNYFHTFEHSKLENNQIKLITELSKSQQFTLDEFEREVIIIFRSIPNELKKYLYTTILEFVKQCPKIQKAMIKTKQNQERKEKEENQLRKEVEKPI
jgi:hypothetical protein